MLHNIVAHTRVQKTSTAKDEMRLIPRYDRRKLERVLRRLQKKSIFEVINIFPAPEIRNAFRHGAPVLYAMRSCVALFSLKGAVLFLERILTNIDNCVIVKMEFWIIREIEQKKAHTSALLKGSLTPRGYGTRPK